MTKEAFMNQVTTLQGYNDKINRFLDALGASECFIDDMLCNIITLTIQSVNPGIPAETIEEEYYYQTFSDMLFDNASTDMWAIYYDMLAAGEIPQEYREKYRRFYE
jgi:hypothetical protein